MPAKLIKPLALVSFLLALANLVATNTFAGRGRSLLNLEQDIASLERQNLKLKLAISQRTAFTSLAPELDKQSFVEPSRVTGIFKPAPVAMR